MDQVEFIQTETAEHVHYWCVTNAQTGLGSREQKHSKCDNILQ